MSSLKNVIKRRTYGERPQPAKRAKLGILEKRSDWQSRAKAHNARQARLEELHAAAEARNADEFSFGMIRRKSKNGVAEIVKQDKFSQAELDILATADLAYLRSKATRERRAIERLQATLAQTDMISRNKTIFVDTDAEAQRVAQREAADRSSSSASTSRTSGRRHREGKVSQRVELAAAKATLKSYNELAARMERLGQIEKLVRAAETQRHRAADPAARELAPSDSDEDSADEGIRRYKWTRERKR